MHMLSSTSGALRAHSYKLPYLGSSQRKHSERLAKLLAPHEGQGQSPAAASLIYTPAAPILSLPQSCGVYLYTVATSGLLAYVDFEGHAMRTQTRITMG